MNLNTYIKLMNSKQLQLTPEAGVVMFSSLIFTITLNNHLGCDYYQNKLWYFISFLIFGAALLSFMPRPLCTDGSLDMRYQFNQGQEKYGVHSKYNGVRRANA